MDNPCYCMIFLAIASREARVGKPEAAGIE